MWFEKSMRRHLMDMHIDDWNEEFLSKFSPEEYVENLKKAKIQNAMVYFQSHVGLCYYPTKTGKIHNAFIGKEDTIKKLVDLCHESGISVTGYYSLIYNNWAHDNFPEWRALRVTGKSRKGSNGDTSEAFAQNDIYRYGHCCPNNIEYRKFVSKQIHEMLEYFQVDGMFFDMLFWPIMCYCDSCKERWRNEVGGEMPTIENYSDPQWILFMEKRRQWMGEYSQSITDEVKSINPEISVEHNVANAVTGSNCGLAEGVLNACDYVGGDLYGGIYRQSFTCKFYLNITKRQPFEYMCSRCTPTLSKHTMTKSLDEMRSSVLLTAAHHGATLMIDAINPDGTMDSRVYDQIGRVFDEEMSYEQYFDGNMIEDVGVYYSLRSKFNSFGEMYNNHSCAVNTADTLIYENIPFGITGGYHDINKYKVLIASCLTDEDDFDNERIVNYVENGGCLYFSGAQNKELLKLLLGADFVERTREKVVYISPTDTVCSEFEHFNAKYPLHFDGTAPIIKNFDKERVVATITLPYTNQDTDKFASIHSNPPGIITEIPALIIKEFGKGKIIWSAIPVENMIGYDYRRIFINLIRSVFKLEQTVYSDAPKNVEVVSFKNDNELYVSTVQLNEDYKADAVKDFSVAINNGELNNVYLLPENKPIDCFYKDGKLCFSVENLDIFKMYRITKG